MPTPEFASWSILVVLFLGVVAIHPWHHVSVFNDKIIKIPKGRVNIAVSEIKADTKNNAVIKAAYLDISFLWLIYGLTIIMGFVVAGTLLLNAATFYLIVPTLLVLGMSVYLNTGLNNAEKTLPSK